MKAKILVETSVLIAASVRTSFPDLGEVRDDFFYQSCELFAIIRKSVSKRLGITTSTVEREAYRTLSKAIINALEKRVRDRSDIFRRKSIMWNICEDKMRRMSDLLLREPMDEQEVVRLTNEAHSMYNDLSRRVRTDYDIKGEAYRRAGGSTGMKQMMFQTHYEELCRQNYQLARLVRTPASPTDKRILAEAAHLADYYRRKEGRDFVMFIASCDSNNFSPANSPFGRSTPVTDEIYARFGVKCAWPREIVVAFQK